jgi:hypothetical protein
MVQEMLNGSQRVLGLQGRDRTIRLRAIEEDLRWQVVLSRTRTAARKASKEMPEIPEESEVNGADEEEKEPAVDPPSIGESAENAPAEQDDASLTPRSEAAAGAEKPQPEPLVRRRTVERRDTRTMTGFG